MVQAENRIFFTKLDNFENIYFFFVSNRLNVNLAHLPVHPIMAGCSVAKPCYPLPPHPIVWTLQAQPMEITLSIVQTRSILPTEFGPSVFSEAEIFPWKTASQTKFPRISQTEWVKKFSIWLKNAHWFGKFSI